MRNGPEYDRSTRGGGRPLFQMIPMKPLLLLIFALALLTTHSARACLWDTDTIAMERARFPEVNELIAGYFVRHSSAYYRWRVDRITALPINEHNPGDYDDLAVAYDKLGDQDQAIDTIQAKIERWPNKATYESQANLGTFYIHAGDYDQGLVHIKRAIEINPEAHFGREIYQRLLVEYVQSKGSLTSGLPLDEGDSYGQGGFARFILEQRQDPNREAEAEIKDAVTGVLGMMRFGHHDSPILLEALGDLLSGGDTNGHQMLAARAYLKASYEVEDPAAADAYRKKAEQTLHSQQNTSLEKIESQLKKEIADGAAYYKEIAATESAWIESGKDLDREFARVYYDAPHFHSTTKNESTLSHTDRMIRNTLIVLGVAAVVFIALFIFLIIKIQSWRARQTTA